MREEDVLSNRDYRQILEGTRPDRTLRGIREATVAQIMTPADRLVIARPDTPIFDVARLIIRPGWRISWGSGSEEFVHYGYRRQEKYWFHMFDALTVRVVCAEATHGKTSTTSVGWPRRDDDRPPTRHRGLTSEAV